MQLLTTIPDFRYEMGTNLNGMKREENVFLFTPPLKMLHFKAIAGGCGGAILRRTGLEFDAVQQWLHHTVQKRSTSSTKKTLYLHSCLNWRDVLGNKHHSACELTFPDQITPCAAGAGGSPKGWVSKRLRLEQLCLHSQNEYAGDWGVYKLRQHSLVTCT